MAHSSAVVRRKIMCERLKGALGKHFSTSFQASIELNFLYKERLALTKVSALLTTPWLLGYPIMKVWSHNCWKKSFRSVYLPICDSSTSSRQLKTFWSARAVSIVHITMLFLTSSWLHSVNCHQISASDFLTCLRIWKGSFVMIELQSSRNSHRT